LSQASGANIGVLISDTFGRAWREGQTNIAIGLAGVEALRHFEGQLDPTGYELRVTMLATADELASAAELVMGKVDGVPAALVRALGRALSPLCPRGLAGGAAAPRATAPIGRPRHRSRLAPGSPARTLRRPGGAAGLTARLAPGRAHVWGPGARSAARSAPP